MRALFRILFLLMLVFAGISLLRGVLGALSPGRSSKRVRNAEGGGRLVKDPVCGTYVPEHSALHSGEHSFCSEECRGKFQKAG
jgi:hypothetical protein